MNKKQIGERLREFLLSKFGKLNFAAQKLEILPQTLTKYLNGNFVPGGELIAKLSEYGCDTNWLLGIEDHTKAEKVSDENSNLYEIKDKIIIQQAEEIFKLKKEAKEAMEQANQIEKRLKDLERRIREEPKLIKKKSGVKNLN